MKIITWNELQRLRRRCLMHMLQHSIWSREYKYWQAHARKLREYQWQYLEDGRF